MDMAVYWYWMIAGMGLMVLEVVTPGVFFLWIGIGALATGGIVFFVPELSGEIQGVIFAVLAVISAFSGRRLMKPKQEIKTTLNRRAEQYIGQIYQVYEPVIDGRGKISVGDTVWLVLAKENIGAGRPVKVTGVKGTYLEVEPVHEKQ